MIHLPAVSPYHPRFLPLLKTVFFYQLLMTAMILAAWFAAGTGMFGNRDFIGFWSASRLVHEGDAALAYSSPHLTKTAHAAVPGNSMIYHWYHPPTTLLLYWPLGLLPCDLSWLVFIIGSSGLLIAVLRRIVDPPLAIWVTLASPPLFLNAWVGQNGALSAAFMGLALLCLEKRPPVSGLGGAGLLCKPHLAPLLCLIELLRYRRALVYTALAVSGVAGLATLTMGASIWQAWWREIPLNDFRAQGSSVLTVHDRMASVFSIGHFIGLGVTASWIMHGIVAGAAVAMALLLWRRNDASFEIKAASVPLATLLISPYLFYYDYVLVLPALAFWMRHISRHGARPGEFNLMALIWALSLWVATYDTPLRAVPLPQLALLGALLFLLRRERRHDRVAHPGG